MDDQMKEKIIQIYHEKGFSCACVWAVCNLEKPSVQIIEVVDLLEEEMRKEP